MCVAPMCLVCCCKSRYCTPGIALWSLHQSVLYSWYCPGQYSPVGTVLLVLPGAVFTSRYCTLVLPGAVFTSQYCTPGIARGSIHQSVLYPWYCPGQYSPVGTVPLILPRAVFTSRYCTLVLPGAVFTSRYCTLVLPGAVCTSRYCTHGIARDSL